MLSSKLPTQNQLENFFKLSLIERIKLKSNYDKFQIHTFGKQLAED